MCWLRCPAPARRSWPAAGPGAAPGYVEEGCSQSQRRLRRAAAVQADPGHADDLRGEYLLPGDRNRRHNTTSAIRAHGSRDRSPNGPWVLAASVPQVIYTIPPTSPMYNVTYVKVYAATPAAVTYGYTSGYMMGFVTAGVVVYGTGYYYPPVVIPGPVPIYYPYPYSYAGNVAYNPNTGAWAQGGAVYGPYGGVAKGGTAYNPTTGAMARAERSTGRTAGPARFPTTTQRPAAMPMAARHGPTAAGRPMPATTIRAPASRAPPTRTPIPIRAGAPAPSPAPTRR